MKTRGSRTARFWRAGVRRWVGIALLLALGAVHAGGQDTTEPPQMNPPAGAVWLSGYPPYETWLSTSRGTVKVQPAVGESRFAIGPWVRAGITRDGNVVVTVQAKSQRPQRVAVVTYSVADGRWTEYAEADSVYAVAISPDGAKLAYIGDGVETNCGYVITLARVIDRKTLRETVEPMGPCFTREETAKIVLSSSGCPDMVLSFSPQGDRLAIGTCRSTVWNLDTNTERDIADGGAPAWSPDGEWIAYLNSSRDKHHGTLGMVHPDGSGDKILITLPRNSSFVETPVWSPDSRTLLLNQLGDGEKCTMYIRLLDLETLQLKTKSRNVQPVFAWAAER